MLPGGDILEEKTDYTGVEELEILEAATNYRSYLAGLICDLARRSKGPEVVDFGTGIGTYAEHARDAGMAVTAVEIDPELRSRSIARGFTTVDSLASLDDERFDGVFSFNVLEHIDDDEEALTQLCRVTKPGGSLLLYVPAFMVLYGGMDKRVGHVRRYRRKALASSVNASGWRVVSHEYVDSLGFLAALVHRLFGAKDGTFSRGSLVAYDRLAFPVSRVLDRLVHRWFGKNVLVWAVKPS